MRGRGMSAQIHAGWGGVWELGGMNDVWWDCGLDVWLDKWIAAWGWLQCVQCNFVVDAVRSCGRRTARPSQTQPSLVLTHKADLIPVMSHHRRQPVSNT